MKYKVGDTVKIKSLDWYNENKSKTGIIEGKKVNFVPSMSNYCGKTVKITKVDSQIYIYKINIDNGWFCWTDEMFENMNNTKEIVLPEGWEVDKIENGKIVLKESNKELPKTWEECCKLLKKVEFINGYSDIQTKQSIMPISEINRNDLPIGLGESMLALCQLLICREVYRQGWKPDWEDKTDKYCIVFWEGNLRIVQSRIAYIFAFRSKKVAEEFLKNFEPLLKQSEGLY